MAEWVPPDDIDAEVVELCTAMNRLPGITTVESCYGHGREPYRIWFAADSLEALPPLLYQFDGCHSSFYDWHVRVTTDCGMAPAVFIAEGPVGPGAVSQASRIALGIAEYLESVGRPVPDTTPLPPKAVTDAEAHVLYRITMWRAAANFETVKVSDMALAVRRQMITDILDAAAPAIRADERDRLIAEQRERLSARPGAPPMDDHERALYWQRIASEAVSRLNEVEDGPDERIAELEPRHAEADEVVRADERERIAKLASERQAFYLVTDCAPGECPVAGAPHAHGFADLIGGDHA